VQKVVLKVLTKDLMMVVMMVEVKAAEMASYWV
jgi:hypothetical protein